MADVPIDIKALTAQRRLAVTWHSRQVEFPFVFLRGQCACAQCVNEWTGERMLDLASIPADIAIVKMELVGSYAVRIDWTDGHNSGLFTWERLLELSHDV